MFGGIFDINCDGKTDAFETALGFSVLFESEGGESGGSYSVYDDLEDAEEDDLEDRLDELEDIENELDDIDSKFDDLEDTLSDIEDELNKAYDKHIELLDQLAALIFEEPDNRASAAHGNWERKWEWIETQISKVEARITELNSQVAEVDEQITEVEAQMAEVTERLKGH